MPTAVARKSTRDRRNGRAARSLQMTEQQYLAWVGDDNRGEWVAGKAELMSPVNLSRMDLNAWLLTVLGVYVKHKKLGRVLGPEFMVRFEDVPSRRIPDLFFVARNRLESLQRTHFEGAPDLIIEIVSPDSASRDFGRKFREYEDAAVREYWIIDQPNRILEFHSLSPAGQFVQLEARDGKLQSKVVRGFYLRPEWLWASPLPNELLVLKELGIQPARFSLTSG